MMLFGGRRLDVHRSRPSNRLPFGRPRFIILEAEPVGRESCRRTRIGVKPAVRPSSGARASPSTRQPSQSARNAEASRLRGRFPPSTPRHPRKAERLVPGLTGASPRNWQDILIQRIAERGQGASAHPSAELVNLALACRRRLLAAGSAPASSMSSPSPYGLSQNCVSKTTCHVLHYDMSFNTRRTLALRSVSPVYVVIPIQANGDWRGP